MNSSTSASLSDCGVALSRLPALEGVCFCEKGEISGSDDEDDNDLPSFKEILACSTRVQPPIRPLEPVIDLTIDSDDDNTEAPPSSSSRSLQPLPGLSANEPAHTTQGSPVAASMVGKRSPWKKIPRWSPLRHKHQRAPTSPPSEPAPAALHAGVDHVEPTLTASEPSFNDTMALTDQSGDSPEIPETPVVALDNVRREEADRSDDGTPPSYFGCSASTIAVDRLLEVDTGKTSVRDMSPSEDVAGSVEADKLRNIDQTDSIIDALGSEGALIFVAESSGQHLASVTPPALSLPALGNDTLAWVDISDFTTMKIIDRRLGRYGVEYKTVFEPPWLPADVVERVNTGRAHIQRYENGRIQAGRLGTLRQRKRKLSQV